MRDFSIFDLRFHRVSPISNLKPKMPTMSTTSSKYKYLDPQALSRLKNLSLAARLVVEGFFAPVMERIPVDGVKERIATRILEKVG